MAHARLCFGAFEIDVKAGEVWRHGRRIRLQEQPCRVLLALLEVPGDTVTRQELRERLWPAETFVDFDNGLNNVINRLRVALGDSASAPRLVETVGRRGYRFIGEVTHSDQVTSAPAHPDTIPEATEAAPVDVPKQLQPLADVSHPVSAGAADASTPARRFTLRRAAWASAATLVVIAGIAELVGPARLFSSIGLGGLVTAASPGIRSLGILPLTPSANDAGDGLFAYGMLNAVIGELSRFQTLKVVSPSSETPYQNRPGRSAQQVGRDLGVDTLLRGSVAQDSQHLGVTLELVDARTGRSVWTKSFARPTTDLVALRSDVVTGVVGQVQARLTPDVAAPVRERSTANTQAYEAYLRGHFETLRRNPYAYARAVGNFSHALAIDPNYAPAHAGLAWARLQQSSWSGDDHPRRHVAEVRKAVAKALALDPGLSEAHAAFAMAARIYDWDWVGAEMAIKRAIQLKPNSALAHNEYTRLLLSLARLPEALTEAEITLTLDPLASANWLNEGVVLFSLRRMGEAEARFQRARELDPGFPGALQRLVRLYIAQGRIVEARAMFRALEQQPSSNSTQVLKAQLEASAGNGAVARRLLAGLGESGLVRAHATAAAAHLALGDRAAALADLRQGMAQKLVQPITFSGPELDGLRTDAKFAAILEEMKLPPATVAAFISPVTAPR